MRDTGITMQQKKVALVVPSIRPDSFSRFIEEWKPTGLFDRVDLVLMEDNPTRTDGFTDVFKRNGVFPVKHFCWTDIDEKSWGHIIPRRSDTVRSFAYWWVYSAGYEYMMTLDDDCYPAPGYERLDEMHVAMMQRTRWFNTLNSVRPRGTPYYNTGYRPVYVNHGLWLGVLDYDAPQQLVDPVPEVHSHDNRIVPHGAYFSFCGMNAMWRREAIPLSYHMMMGQHMKTTRVTAVDPQQFIAAGNGHAQHWTWDPAVYQYGGRLVEQDHKQLERLPFDRFGDIWCGIVQKRICDHLGWAVGSGTPYIHHDRASNVFANLKKEANGIAENETFWEFVDSVHLPPEITTAAACYALIGQVIYERGLNEKEEYREYWKLLGEAMITWSDLF